MIINGELKTGLGGGVCQVSTTVFNAAYEAGLPITARTNHALYISHYPQGRDATVNYPDTDLKFVNDTGHWLLLRTFVGSSSLTVALYGTPRTGASRARPRRSSSTGPPPVKRVKDPTLTRARRCVDESGSPSRSTSVHAQGLSARRQAALRRRPGTRSTGRAAHDPHRHEAEGRSRRRLQPPPEKTKRRHRRRRRLRSRRRRPAHRLGLGRSDRLGEPGGQPRRAERRRRRRTRAASSRPRPASPSRSTE